MSVCLCALSILSHEFAYGGILIDAHTNSVL